MYPETEIQALCSSQIQTGISGLVVSEELETTEWLVSLESFRTVKVVCKTQQATLMAKESDPLALVGEIEPQPQVL